MKIKDTYFNPDDEINSAYSESSLFIAKRFLPRVSDEEYDSALIGIDLLNSDYENGEY